MLFQHKKTGHLYEFRGLTIIEKTMEPAVRYAPPYSENVEFIRPAAEFFDGRFIPYVDSSEFFTPAPLHEPDQDDELPTPEKMQ
jgi:hypothetical protein